MMDVCHSCHSHEGHVVQEPSDDRIQATVVNLVEFIKTEFFVAALPSNQIPGNEAAEDRERGSRTPVYEWVAEQEVLDYVVVPAAHAETNVQDWPLPELRGEVILFVGVRDEGVVRGHHGDVQVDEVAEEGGFVLAWITCRNYKSQC